MFNDVAVASHYLINRGLANKILIFDLDVHQGDGSATMLKGVESVFTFSIHCGGNFPLKKQKSDLDVELEDNLEDKNYIKILTEQMHQV